MILKTLLLALLAAPALASEDIPDQDPQSVLYEKPVEVIPGIFSAIGATAPPTYENAGHNNNLSFIVTGDGVIVVNAGANAALAKALHDEIRAVTDQPVKLVINENGQGHAMLGNSYWVEQGIDVLAHVDAAEEFADTSFQLLEGMKRYARENAQGTVAQGPTMTFEDSYTIDLGDMHIEVLHLGPAHSPGDIQVWLPEQRFVIAGDIAFHERMPPIFAETCTSSLRSAVTFSNVGCPASIPSAEAASEEIISFGPGFSLSRRNSAPITNLPLVSLRMITRSGSVTPG